MGDRKIIQLGELTEEAAKALNNLELKIGAFDTIQRDGNIVTVTKGDEIYLVSNYSAEIYYVKSS